MEKLPLSATKEPLMSVAICAELDNKVLPNSDSAVVTLVEKLPLSAVILVEKLPLSATN